MTQGELCRKLGKHLVWASKRERGHLPVRREDVPGLAEALQVGVAELQSRLGGRGRPDEAEERGLLSQRLRISRSTGGISSTAAISTNTQVM